jgi:hypothetical protein
MRQTRERDARGSPQGQNLADLTQAVCECLGLSRQALMSRSRRQRLVHARQLAMSLGYNLAGASVSDLARYFGRDRATVYHAVQVTAQRLTQPRYQHLRDVWQQIHKEFHVMDRLEETLQALAAMRLLSAYRNMEMAKLVAQGHASADEIDLESRQLTALVKRLEAVVTGVPLPLAPSYQFSDEALTDCLDLNLARVRATGSPEQAHYLAMTKVLLGLGSVDIPLPPMDDEAAAPEPPEAHHAE